MIPDRILEPYRLWWDNRNTEPLFAIYNEGTEFESDRFRKDWMDRRLYPGSALAQGMEFTVRTGDFGYLDDAITFVYEHLKTLGFDGEAFPHVELNLGPGVVAAFITGYSRYRDGTVWFEPTERVSWEELFQLGPEVESHYATIAMQGIERIAEFFDGIAVVSQTDLGGILDILASLRSTGQLLLDIHDCPDTVKSASGMIEKIWQRYFSRIADIIISHNDGLYTSWMYLLSDSIFYPSQCDLGAMISAGSFAEIALPSLRREARFVKKMVYHLDGTGELPHVDHILTIEHLHAVQWVAEPGNESELSDVWYPLYRKIIESGKKIVLYYLPPNFDDVKKLLRVFPKESFYLEFYVKRDSDAQDLLSLRDSL